MKAIVWHGVGDIRLDDVADPIIEQPTDAIVRLTSSAICGTDLHLVRGTMPDMVPGTVIGHEGVGVIEDVGSAVRGFAVGERVVICSTVSCGFCVYCRAGYTAQCDNANPNGPQAGTSFFGGPQATGPVPGLQAEYARIPFAASTLVKVPDPVIDEQAIMVSDVLPTGWFGARLAQVGQGDTVLVMGAGVVGQCAIASAKRQGAARVLMIDGIASRLEMAQRQNAEVIDFNAENPVEAVMDLTGGIGVDRVIEAVGVDAQRPDTADTDALPVSTSTFNEEVDTAAPEADPDGTLFTPGGAPSLAARWAVQSVAKAGTIGIIGVYPPGFDRFPIGDMMNRNLTVQGGNCNHRRYIPRLLAMVAAGTLDPTTFITQETTPDNALDAYRHFDQREQGWIKTILDV